MNMQNEIDYRQFIEDFFDIVDKNERRVPFQLNSVQAKLYDNLCGRDIVLKARQEGVSSLVLALFTVDFLLMDNSRSVCIAHDKDSTIKLFERVKYYIRTFEEKSGTKVPMTYDTRSEIMNENNNSSFYIGTAGSKSFGRSATLTNVHLSEIAFYNYAEQVYMSVSQAGTPKRIIIESTANGVGDYFYQSWNDAIESKSNYKPHFFGWQDHDEYRAPVGTPILMNDKEKKMQTQFQLTKEQMAWRRAKLMEFRTEAGFNQEYPMTPDEAFISSGNPVFDVEALREYKAKEFFIQKPKVIGNLVGIQPPVIEKNENGYLRVWKMPKPHREYVIGADIAEGSKDGDFSCAQVIDRLSFEQVAVWHGRVDTDVFGRELNKLGLLYNQAILAPERNAMGIATILTLRELDYPRLYVRENIGQIQEKLSKELGWRTDMKSKPAMISSTAKAVRERTLVIHDELTLNELLSYQYDSQGHANAAQGGYDDRVIALMIAVEMYKRTPLDQNARNEVSNLHVTGEQYDPILQTSPDFSTQDFNESLS